MNAESFERMVDHITAYIDGHNITKSIRELGFNVRCATWVQENESSGAVYATLRIGLEGVPSSYIIVFDKFVKFTDTSIGKFVLMNLYMKALKNLHKLAINSKYGLNCYMPAEVINSTLDTGCSPYNDILNVYRYFGSRADSVYVDESFKKYIKEDTDMTYTLLNKKNPRRGMTYLMTVEPEKIHFNGPATIVEWNDGTKTVVKCQRGDTFDPLTGVAMCCMKKMLGTNASGSNYLNDVTKLIDEAWEAKNKRYAKKEKALKQKKEVANPEWNVIAEKLDKDFREKAINMLLNAIDNVPDNFHQEDKEDEGKDN